MDRATLDRLAGFTVDEAREVMELRRKHPELNSYTIQHLARSLHEIRQERARLNYGEPPAQSDTVTFIENL